MFEEQKLRPEFDSFWRGQWVNCVVIVTHERDDFGIAHEVHNHVSLTNAKTILENLRKTIEHAEQETAIQE